MIEFIDLFMNDVGTFVITILTVLAVSALIFLIIREY